MRQLRLNTTSATPRRSRGLSSEEERGWQVSGHPGVKLIFFMDLPKPLSQLLD